MGRWGGYPKSYIDSETGDLTIVTNGNIIHDDNSSWKKRK